MQFSHYIGVDISKSTLDAAIYASEMKKADTKHVTNDAAGLKELMSWVKTNGVKPKTMVVCAEHTGVYGNALQLFCEKKVYLYALRALCRSSVPWVLFEARMTR